jgi:hypothetical protein
VIERLRFWIGLPGRFHLYGSLGILLFCSLVISAQMTDRRGFANADLHQDVLERWGAPLEQAAPSVRYVESGSVFNALHAVALDRQHVQLDATMNYRKRGLVYFSGFDFAFRGEYGVRNPEPRAIDVVFVFPVPVARQSMLQDLAFRVNGEPAPLPFDETARRLTWTGRLEPEQRAVFEIAFGGRGLESFQYFVDPELPVRDFKLDVAVAGSDAEFDYPPGAFPAGTVEHDERGVHLAWSYESLEAGFDAGVVLPAEKSFDEILKLMIRRAWPPFLLFMACVVGLALHRSVSLGRWSTYFAAAVYSFFYVLLPYLAAYMNFYAAYALSVVLVGALLVDFLSRLLGRAQAGVLAGLWVALLGLPTLAVICEPHTGLIYTLEILAGLIAGSWLIVRPEVQRVLQSLEAAPEVSHAS